MTKVMEMNGQMQSRQFAGLFSTAKAGRFPLEPARMAEKAARRGGEKPGVSIRLKMKTHFNRHQGGFCGRVEGRRLLTLVLHLRQRIEDAGARLSAIGVDGNGRSGDVETRDRNAAPGDAARHFKGLIGVAGALGAGRRKPEIPRSRRG